MEFKSFNKIPRLNREMIITEKIDGTNGVICITEDGEFLVGSRNKWITPENDNYGFAKWCYENKEELLKLGVGWHCGEWWGKGIQRGYNQTENHFSLFNTSRWNPINMPSCCEVVPVLFRGDFDTDTIDDTLLILHTMGSWVAEGYMNAEGIVIFHTALNGYFKVTIKGDEKPKGAANYERNK